jgi:hypothetical protein
LELRVKPPSRGPKVTAHLDFNKIRTGSYSRKTDHCAGLDERSCVSLLLTCLFDKATIAIARYLFRLLGNHMGLWGAYFGALGCACAPDLEARCLPRSPGGHPKVRAKRSANRCVELYPTALATLATVQFVVCK